MRVANMSDRSHHHDMDTVKGHPIFGHLREFRTDRAGILTRLGIEHDIVRVPMGLLRNLVSVGSPAIANEILSTKASSFKKAPGLTIMLRPVLGNGLLTSDGDFHASQRKLLAPAFAHKRISSYATTMAVRANRFAESLRDGESLDVADAMMRLTFEIVGKTLFDAELNDDASEVAVALTTVMECMFRQLESLVPIPPAIPTPSNLRYQRAVRQLDRLVYRIIRERRAVSEDRGDVLSMLLAARDEDGKPMSDKQVRDEAMTLLMAGHETTANALSWTFHLLAQHPTERETMEKELDALGRNPTYDDLAKLPYTLAVFKESMRLYPPAYMVARRAKEDVTVGANHVIEKGSICFVSVIGIHHRPDVFADPERFDPTRFLGDKEKQLPRCAYLPFGAGPRVCIGNHFALMEGHVLLATIARQARFDSLPSRAKVELEPLVTLRPKDGLEMRVTTRSRAGVAKRVAGGLDSVPAPALP
jgi:cytochrome P450